MGIPDSIGVVVVSNPRVGNLPIVFIIRKHVKFQNLIMIHQWRNLLKFKEKVFSASNKILGPETENDSLTKKVKLTKFGCISGPYRLENSILSVKF